MTELHSPETLDRLVPQASLLPRPILGGFSPPHPLGRQPPPALSSDQGSPDEMEADGCCWSPYARDDEEKEVSPEEDRYDCSRRRERELSRWSPWCPRRRLICDSMLLPAPPIREIVPSGVVRYSNSVV